MLKEFSVLNGKNTETTELCEELNNGLIKDWSKYPDIHTVSLALKRYFRALSDASPFFEIDLFDKLNKTYGSENVHLTIKSLISDIENTKFLTLKYLIKYLNDVSKNSDINKMLPANLAICFSPNFSPKTSESVNQFSSTYWLEVMITFYEQIFDGTDFAVDMFFSDDEVIALRFPPIPPQRIAYLASKNQLRTHSSKHPLLIPVIPNFKLPGYGFSLVRPKKKAPPPPDEEFIQTLIQTKKVEDINFDRLNLIMGEISEFDVGNLSEAPGDFGESDFIQAATDESETVYNEINVNIQQDATTSSQSEVSQTTSIEKEVPILKPNINKVFSPKKPDFNNSEASSTEFEEDVKPSVSNPPQEVKPVVSNPRQEVTPIVSNIPQEVKPVVSAPRQEVTPVISTPQQEVKPVVSAPRKEEPKKLVTPSKQEKVVPPPPKAEPKKLQSKFLAPPAENTKPHPIPPPRSEPKRAGGNIMNKFANLNIAPIMPGGPRPRPGGGGGGDSGLKEVKIEAPPKYQNDLFEVQDYDPQDIGAVRNVRAVKRRPPKRPVAI